MQDGPLALAPITLVVPVRDEAQSIGALLDSVAAQTRSPEHIIVVDAGSLDGTPELAARDPRVRVIKAGPATPGRARNIGIAAAHTEWVALTDAGIELDPRWLEELERAALAGGGCDVVYGHYEPRIRSAFDECAAIAYVPPPHPSPAGLIRGPFVASLFVRRASWEAAGGFPDLRAGEDTVFLQRLERLGARPAWAPRAVITWAMAPTLVGTFRRFRLYSYHGVVAGRQSNWHHGVARIYLGAGAAALAARLVDRRLVLVLPGAGLLRVLRRILAHRAGRPLSWALAPRRLAGVATILAAADLALFVGWAEALLRGRGAGRR